MKIGKWLADALYKYGYDFSANETVGNVNYALWKEDAEIYIAKDCRDNWAIFVRKE